MRRARPSPPFASPQLKFLATWKLQFLFASYQCLVIIMYALHPVLGWNIDNGSGEQHQRSNWAPL